MYLRETKQTRRDGTVITHLQLAESVWNTAKGRSETRIVYNCGRAGDPAVVERLRRLARGILRRCSPEEIVRDSQAIRFPPDVVFYALDERGQTALHRAGELIFAFPSDVGSPTLRDSVKTMLGQPEGVVHYRYGGSDRTAVFQRSRLTGWVFVMGKSHPQE